MVLVTGGGTGLGRAAAVELAACGARVVIAGRREDVLRSAAEEIGHGLTYVRGDVRRDDDAEGMVRSCLDRHGRLDVLVNNAGGQYFTPAEAIEPKGWRAVTALNVGGTERMTSTAVELAMRPAGGGTIVSITLSPHHGLTGMAHSSAARAAVEGYTRALAHELGARGHLRPRPRRRALRHRVPAQVPRARLARGRPHRPAPAPRPRAGARLARRPRRLTARPRAVGLRDHARRRPRQLVRTLAAALADPADRRRPHRGAPPALTGAARGKMGHRPLRAKCCGCTEAFQASRAGSIPVARLRTSHGEWRSLVAHPAGGRAVAGSNPVSPIERKPCKCGPFAVLGDGPRPDGVQTGSNSARGQFLPRPYAGR